MNIIHSPLVRCRTGSLESACVSHRIVFDVRCRTGSLERPVLHRQSFLAVRCRTGSLETNIRRRMSDTWVRCRTGSLEMLNYHAKRKLELELPRLMLNDEFWSTLKKIQLQEAIYNKRYLRLTVEGSGIEAGLVACGGICQQCSAAGVLSTSYW